MPARCAAPASLGYPFNMRGLAYSVKHFAEYSTAYENCFYLTATHERWILLRTSSSLILCPPVRILCVLTPTAQNRTRIGRTEVGDLSPRKRKALMNVKGGDLTAACSFPMPTYPVL